VLDTATTNTRSDGGYYSFETDTLKIIYSFWANNGVLSFTIFNKLDKPLYVDWKNSSFIRNGKALYYWLDESQTNMISQNSGFIYKGPLLSPGYSINYGNQNTSAHTVKPERITFIPPHSYCYKSEFYLWPNSIFKFNNNVKEEIVKRNDKPNKKTKVYHEEYSLVNSPLTFRNFLAFSFSENSNSYFFADNEFYLTTVNEMDFRHYKGKFLGYDKKNNHIYAASRFEKETSFYIKILRKNSTEVINKYSQ
jgi:hypothetical protein